MKKRAFILNPVESGFIMNPWEWKYSSIRNYFDDYQEIFEIDVNL
jgi:putative transposase